MKQCTWVKNLSLGKDLVIQGLVPHPKMVGKELIPNPRTADRELFPSLGIMISEPIGIGPDLQVEGLISSIKTDQGLH